MNESIDTVLFDLGNTLVRYYEMPEFPGILASAIAEAHAIVREHTRHNLTPEILKERVAAENYEAEDYQVRPLGERLARIFDLPAGDPLLIEEVCRAFMRPVFALAELYPDTLPALQELRARGCRIGIVSNSPWGSPASLWLEETARLGLNDLADAMIFCGDAGWRKPARAIFELALRRLDASPERCIFIGDDPRWDLIGPRQAGIRGVVLDRSGTGAHDAPSIRSLKEIPGLLEQYVAAGL